MSASTLDPLLTLYYVLLFKQSRTENISFKLGVDVVAVFGFCDAFNTLSKLKSQRIT